MATIINNPSPAVRLLVVDAESDGQRLDNYLLRELKGAPKSLIYRLIRSGEVRRNKGRVQADSRVVAGDVLRIPPLRLAASAQSAPDQAGMAAAPAREFPVLFEDDALLAIDKPAGVAVHGGSGVSFGVIEQLRRARPQAPLLELVHRLDRETSGVLLVAKKRSVLRLLQEQLRQRSMGKSYLALVKGPWPARLKVLDWQRAASERGGIAGDPGRKRGLRDRLPGAAAQTQTCPGMGAWRAVSKGGQWWAVTAYASGALVSLWSACSLRR